MSRCISSLKALLLIFVFCSLSGCGAMLTGTHETIPTDSNPQGAEIWIDGVMVGKTPLKLEVDSSAEHTIVFKYEDKEHSIRTTHRLKGGFVFLDIFFTGLIGIIVDAATGGWYVATPSSINVDLEAIENQGGK